ncbi:hypothetical protein Hypma_000963 [Hypsizygus marmoreus]|uniref:Peptidase M43 pregnancy-associated plasma-A domain-containing protein n=1 Tax=Hypsizygus marmoreus TaxID=39966 RepID=A0A369JEF7_HYPMA|nr:hypothetical protein Hypma_000963 [Hypsizygus marmoreus]
MMFHRLIWLTLHLAICFSFVRGGPVFNSRAPDEGRGGCGSELTKDDVAAAESSFQDRKAWSSFLAAGAAFAPVEIEVYWHVVAANTTISGGWIPQSQIDAQMAVLNEDYADVGVSWRYVNTTRIISADWFRNISPSTSKANIMKQLFRKGGATSLNVFTVGFIGSNLLGYSTFPWRYDVESEIDGIVLRYSSVPGGISGRVNAGRTLTHEVGHWLGLYHTFQGGCDDGQGDLVDDTPAVKAANFGCPTVRDTCAGGGLDLINNFMDYTDDDCKTGFTDGQIARMQAAVQIYRSA